MITTDLRRLVAFGAALLLAAFFITPARAQAVLQAGGAIGGHGAMYVPNGSPLGNSFYLQDIGPAGNFLFGQGMSETLQVNRSAIGSGPSGAHNCAYDKPSLSAGYHYLCWDANAAGGGLLTYNTGGAIAQLPFNMSLGGDLDITSGGAAHIVANALDFTINGIFYPFPFSDVTSAHVPNQASLAAYTLSATTLIRDGFNTPGDGGSATYALNAAPCSQNAGAGDGGSQIPFAGGGKCWLIDKAQALSPKIWGAIADGINDDTAATQAAANYVCSTQTPVLSGGSLLLLPGKTRFHDLDIRCPGFHLAGAEIGSTNFGGPPISSGTQVDCSGMVAFCVRFRPPSFPAFAAMDGGSVDNITFNTTNRTGVILEMDQIRAPKISRVGIWNALNGIKLFGGIAGEVRDIQMWNMSGIGLEGNGDLSGPACTLTACATRQDFLVLNNVAGGDSGTNTSIGYYFHDQIFTIQGNDVQWEGGAKGIQVACGAGQPSLAYCPQQLLFKGLNLEFAITPADIADYTGFRCSECYFAGQDTTHTINTVSARLVNYPPIPGGGGNFTLMNSEVFNAANSCVFIAAPDSTIIGSQINICNGSLGSGAGVEYFSGAQHKLIGDTLCNVNGSSPTQMLGYLIDVAASGVSASSNSYFGCVIGGSLAEMRDMNQSGLNFEVNANPPPGPPILAAGSGGFGVGTGTAVLGVPSSDRGGSVLLTAGTGAAAAGTFTLTFHQSIFPAPACWAWFERGTGLWQTNASFVNNGAGLSPTVYEFDWNNGGVALTPGSGYFVAYKCTQSTAG